MRRSVVGALLVASCSPTQQGSPLPSPPAHASTRASPINPSIIGTVVWTPETTRKPTGIVYVEDAPKQPGVAATADVFIKNKELTPFIAVIAAGGTVTFANRDALTHHVFSPDLPGWDTGYLAKDQATPKRFDAPGAYSLLCNIHPEMLSYLVVIPSTAFGAVGGDGKYAIADLTPGTYRVTAWGPRMQPVTEAVTIEAGRPSRANFELHPAASQP